MTDIRGLTLQPELGPVESPNYRKEGQSDELTKDKQKIPCIDSFFPARCALLLHGADDLLSLGGLSSQPRNVREAASSDVQDGQFFSLVSVDEQSPIQVVLVIPIQLCLNHMLHFLTYVIHVDEVPAQVTREDYDEGSVRHYRTPFFTSSSLSIRTI